MAPDVITREQLQCVFARWKHEHNCDPSRFSDAEPHDAWNYGPAAADAVFRYRDELFPVGRPAFALTRFVVHIAEFVLKLARPVI